MKETLDDRKTFAAGIVVYVVIAAVVISCLAGTIFLWWVMQISKHLGWVIFFQFPIYSNISNRYDC